MDKEIDYLAVFMPEGQCARCGTSVPLHQHPFQTLSGQKIELGFCTRKCENDFVQGIEAVNHAAERT